MWSIVSGDIGERPHLTLEQAAAEIAAQIPAFHRTGLPLDHLSGHKHFHVHPTIAKMVLGMGRNLAADARPTLTNIGAGLRLRGPLVRRYEQAAAAGADRSEVCLAARNAAIELGGFVDFL